MNNSFSEIWNCPDAFEFVCNKQWEGLNPTEVNNIRYCDVCSENVYLSSTPQEFVRNSTLGRCVAVPRQGMPPTPLLPCLTGMPSPEFVREFAEHQAQYKIWWNIALSHDPSVILCLIQKKFPDLLELFIELTANFPEEQTLLEEASQLLSNSDEKDKFALYLVRIGKVAEAVQIAKTLKDDQQFLMNLFCRLLEIDSLEEALEVSTLLIPSNNQSIAFINVAGRLMEHGQFKKAIDVYELAFVTAHSLSANHRHKNQILMNLRVLISKCGDLDLRSLITQSSSLRQALESTST